MLPRETPPNSVTEAGVSPRPKGTNNYRPIWRKTALLLQSFVQAKGRKGLAISTAALASPLLIVAIMPLRDDWVSAAHLIRQLDQAVASSGCTIDVLLVDDGSVQTCEPADFHYGYSVVRSIRILRLRRNLSHQRAIALGLAHVERYGSCDAVLVMDADGEDTPEGALQLLEAFAASRKKQTAAIFAERSQRTESFAFRVFYQLYRMLHRLFTGIDVRVGNFSILPASYLSTLVAMSELWNHYAACVFRSGLPFTMIPIPRGFRIAGRSRMNFSSLATHGISAISVFGDVVGVRLLIMSALGALTAVMGIVVVILIRFFTDWAIPGWATYAVGTLVIIVVQFITIAVSFTFTLLSNRTSLGFVPYRDYDLFVAGSRDVYPND
jgi:polyisoprenyl-phosphate glycosyltransferase